MAQLSNDCFAFGERLMMVEEALALIEERVGAVVAEEVLALPDLDGRILSRDIAAPVPLPPFDNSAVDGYAVRFCDLDPDGETVLQVRGRVPAGARPDPCEAGRAATRIFTGAPMPSGLDTVFMQEDVRVDGDRVVLPPGLNRGANARPAGEDIGAGTLALAAGRRLAPQDVGLLAALGLSQATVRQRLRVAVFSTGDEIVAPGDPLAPAKLYDANRFMLVALLRRLGCAVTDLGILPDRREHVAQALAQAATRHDLLLTSGGVSTGEEDHVKSAVESAGALTLWRIAIKPGRPVALGVVAGVAFIGLPGNPVAAFVTFVQIARPLIARLAGETYRPPRPLPVFAAFSYKKKEGRREFVRVSLSHSPEGRLEVRKFPREGAGVITSLTQTDGIVELPETVTRVAPGDVVGFYPYGGMF